MALAVRVIESPLVKFILLLFGYSIILLGIVVLEMNSCLPNTGLSPKAIYFYFFGFRDITVSPLVGCYFLDHRITGENMGSCCFKSVSLP